MKAETQRSIEWLLASEQAREIHQGLELVRREIARLGAEEARPYFEMVSSLFNIDPHDRPDLMPVLDEGIALLVGFGNWVIPYLIEKLDEGDLKAQMSIATALGRLGADGIEPLMNAYEKADTERRAFILFALGKVKSPKILVAVDLAAEAAGHEDRELRDTGTRAIGKLLESIEPDALGEEQRRVFLSVLRSNLADGSSGIRAKAVRSLGKMARFGFLEQGEKEQLEKTFMNILGKDEAYDWDRAYAVRREAETALKAL